MEEVQYVDYDYLGSLRVYDNSHIVEEVERIAEKKKQPKFDRFKIHPLPPPLRQVKCPDDLTSITL
jgi:hypothetical protein